MWRTRPTCEKAVVIVRIGSPPFLVVRFKGTEDGGSAFKIPQSIPVRGKNKWRDEAR